MNRPAPSPSPIAVIALPLASSWREVAAQLRRWGWPFASGATCLLVAGAVALLWLPDLRRTAGRLGSSADLAEHRARALRAQARSTTPPRSESQRFVAGFPEPQTRQARLGALFALASARHLELHPSEFKLAAEPDSGLLAYGVTMPLTGPYAQVRDFIAAAQASDPSLSLDRLRLRRASPGATIVEAELAWTLFMQPAAVDALPGARPVAAGSPAASSPGKP